jgi:hypothetical protein
MIVMGNTMRVAQSSNIQYVFDLKGSMVNRIVKDTTNVKPSSPLKDQNLLKLCKPNLKKLLRFSEKDAKTLNKMIEGDVELLSEFNLMDYSLLMCIEKVPKDHKLPSWNNKDRRH